MIWSEATQNVIIRSREFLRHGTYVVPAFICLSPHGLPFVRMTRFEVSAFLAGSAYSIVTLTYAFVDGGFYLPIFFLLVALAVLPAEWAVSKVLKLRFPINGWGV